MIALLLSSSTTAEEAHRECGADRQCGTRTDRLPLLIPIRKQAERGSIALPLASSSSTTAERSVEHMDC